MGYMIIQKRDKQKMSGMVSDMLRATQFLMNTGGELMSCIEEMNEMDERNGMDMRGGSYARGRGRNARRDAMGRYSSEGYSRAEDDFRADLEELMAMAPNDQIRQKMQRIMSDM